MSPLLSRLSPSERSPPGCTGGQPEEVRPVGPLTVPRYRPPQRLPEPRGCSSTPSCYSCHDHKNVGRPLGPSNSLALDLVVMTSDKPPVLNSCGLEHPELYVYQFSAAFLHGALVTTTAHSPQRRGGHGSLDAPTIPVQMQRPNVASIHQPGHLCSAAGTGEALRIMGPCLACAR